MSPHHAPLSSPQVPCKNVIFDPINGWKFSCHLPSDLGVIVANCDRPTPDLPTVANPLTPPPMLAVGSPSGKETYQMHHADLTCMNMFRH